MRMLTNEEREQLAYYRNVAAGAPRIETPYDSHETATRNRLAEFGRISVVETALHREGHITDMGLKALRIAAILDQYV